MAERGFTTTASSALRFTTGAARGGYTDRNDSPLITGIHRLRPDGSVQWKGESDFGFGQVPANNGGWQDHSRPWVSGSGRLDRSYW